MQGHEGDPVFRFIHIVYISHQGHLLQEFIQCGMLAVLLVAHGLVDQLLYVLQPGLGLHLSLCLQLLLVACFVHNTLYQILDGVIL